MFKSVWRSRSLKSKIQNKQSIKASAAMRLFFSAAVIGLAGLASLSSGVVHAKTSTDAQPQKLDTVSVSRLPTQAQDMLTLIYQGGPFRYDKDGVVFGNRERILPAKDRGFYREYTVRTPAERSRGARRIVCGGLKPTAPDACFYTDDHYASFRKIVQ
jgi:ribonuclease T1